MASEHSPAQGHDTKQPESNTNSTTLEIMANSTVNRDVFKRKADFGGTTSVVDKIKPVASENETLKKRDNLGTIQILGGILHENKTENATTSGTDNGSNNAKNGHNKTAQAHRSYSKRSPIKKQELDNGFKHRVGGFYLRRDLGVLRPKLKKRHAPPSFDITKGNIMKHRRSYKNEPEDNRLSYLLDNNNPLAKLTKMMVDSNEEETQGPGQIEAVEEFISPVSRFTEIIFKPMGMKVAPMNNFGLAGLNDYSVNRFGTIIPQEKHEDVPLLYENPMSYLSNELSSYGWPNAIEETAELKKEDDFDMACPVHSMRYKRNIDGHSKDGFLDVCSCHLIKRKKLF